MLVGQLHEGAAGGAVLVHHLDGGAQIVIGDGLAGDLLQLSLDVLILVHGELQAEGGLALLGMGQEDAGQLALHGHAEVLAHGAQGVADGGGNEAVQLIQSAVQQHLQGQLSDGAVEGGAVLLGMGDGLLVAAPDAHGHHAGGNHQLRGSVVGQHADDLLTFLLVLGEDPVRMLGNLRKLVQKNLGAHFSAPSFAA